MGLIPMDKGKMLIEEKGQIYIYEYEPNAKKIKGYKESFLATGMENNYRFATLHTNNKETLSNYFCNEVIKYSDLVYKKDEMWSSFEEIGTLNLGFYPKDKQNIIVDYIKGKYDVREPIMIYGRLSNKDTKDNPLKYFVHTGFQMNVEDGIVVVNILMIPRKLYLLGMLQNGMVDVASEGNISVQARCFDYNLGKFYLELYKDFTDEQIHTQARMGTRILQKGGILK